MDKIHQKNPRTSQIANNQSSLYGFSWGLWHVLARSRTSFGGNQIGICHIQQLAGMDRKYKTCPAFGASAKSRFYFPLSQPRCLPRALHSADFTRSFPRCRNEGEYWPKWLNFWGWWGIMSYHHLSRFQIFSDKSHLNSFKIHELSHFRLVRIKIIQIFQGLSSQKPAGNSWSLCDCGQFWRLTSNCTVVDQHLDAVSKKELPFRRDDDWSNDEKQLYNVTYTFDA